ncbi:MAG: hypothetical protein ACRD18_10610 [Terriglobia bacterium]
MPDTPHPPRWEALPPSGALSPGEMAGVIVPVAIQPSPDRAGEGDREVIGEGVSGTAVFLRNTGRALPLS